MSHGKWTLSVPLCRKKKDTQGFGEESREPSTGKASFLDSEIGPVQRGQFFLSQALP